jgi:tryptophan-rich sensory protein
VAVSSRGAQWVWLLLLLAATAVTGALGALASVSAGEFYAALTRPSWAPPADLFGPVWTLLYLSMALAAWLVVRAAGGRAARPAMALFFGQLAVNGLWSWLFFRWHLGAAAFVDVLVLLGLIVLCVRSFWRRRPLAGALMLPYLAWVAFASALTWAVWRANPALL